MLPKPGSPSYLPRLLAYLSSHPSVQPFEPDHILFAAVFLTLIVNRGGLIVNLPSAQISKRAGLHLTSILQLVFGRHVRHAAFDPTVEPLDVAPRLVDAKVGPGRAVIMTGVEGMNGPSLLQLNDILVKRSLVLDPDGPHGGRKVPLPSDTLFVWLRATTTTNQPGWWIDQFVTSITCPSSLSAPPPLSSDQPIADAPISQRYLSHLRALLDFTHIHPPLSVHITNLFSAIFAHPRLLPTLTARAVRSFPEFVKAHRILSTPFDLPPDWEEALDHRDRLRAGRGGGERYGLGGGLGGVDSWAILAGEEPGMESLTRREGDVEDDMEGWFCGLENVQGVGDLCLRHRVKLRKDKGDIMWLLNGPAAGGVRDDEERNREQVLDRIMDDIIRRM